MLRRKKQLKFGKEIYDQFGSLSRFAISVGLPRTFISRIVNGWEIPSSRHIEMFEAMLGKRARDLFE